MRQSHMLRLIINGKWRILKAVDSESTGSGFNSDSYTLILSRFTRKDNRKSLVNAPQDLTIKRNLKNKRARRFRVAPWCVTSHIAKKQLSLSKDPRDVTR